MVWKDKPLGVFEIGMDRGMYIAILGAQGLKGDNDMDEPSVFNIPKHMFWVEWNKIKGMPKDTGQRLLIAETDITMAKHNLLHLLENENRPGPDYYKDCIKFNWVSALVKSHQKHVEDNGGDYSYYTLTEEDIKWQKKLKMT